MGHQERPVGLSTYPSGTEACLQQDLCAGAWCLVVCCSSGKSRQNFSALKVVFDVEGELRRCDGVKEGAVIGARAKDVE